MDGFNLYFRAIRHTPYKWLNIQALAEQMLPQSDVLKVKYYTADIRSRGDAQKPLRQETFLRALRTLPKVEIHKGLFSVQKVNRELVQPSLLTRIRRRLGLAAGMNRCVKVYDPKEIGSAVNLAVHLVNDAWHDRYDVAIVLSNDTDLLEAVRIVRHDCNKKVGTINPQPNPNPQLQAKQILSDNSAQQTWPPRSCPTRYRAPRYASQPDGETCAFQNSADKS